MTSERLAAKLRGFGPVGVAAALVVLAFGPILEPFNSLPALVWIHLSRTPWREVGLARPKSWVATIAAGVLGGTALKLFSKSVLMPLVGAPAVNPDYHYLFGNAAALPEMMVDVILGAGFGEELVFRGFLFERLGKLLGASAAAKTAIVLATGILFGAVHYPLGGIFSATQATFVGLVYGAVFAQTGRLWPLIAAHAAFNVVAVLIIYLGWEEAFAHLIFR